MTAGAAGAAAQSRATAQAAVEVAVVGGGPAGALTAMLLAGLGHDVAVLERAPRWRWRACGVFSSPASITALRRLGVAEAELARVAQPLAAMEVVSQAGTRFALTYGGSSSLSDSAVGFDRSALDPLLLSLAAAAGAHVREGVAVERVDLDGGRPRLVPVAASGLPATTARIVVGADGLRSTVASAAGVVRRPAIGPRAALTFHVRDPGLHGRARMIVIRDGYVGLAPVPGGRINVGIVVGGSWFAAMRRYGGGGVARDILRLAMARAWPDQLDKAEPPGRSDVPLDPLDHVAGVTPLAHAVGRRAGDGWLLVGDAAGFLDPFTGEGLHRAIRSAELAAESVHAALARGRVGSLAAYESAMRREFATKDLVSRVVQAFLGRPALFEHAARRLRAREAVRDTMGRVMGDLVPASQALDPRYLLELLRP